MCPRAQVSDLVTPQLPRLIWGFKLTYTMTPEVPSLPLTSPLDPTSTYSTTHSVLHWISTWHLVLGKSKQKSGFYPPKLHLAAQAPKSFLNPPSLYPVCSPPRSPVSSTCKTHQNPTTPYPSCRYHSQIESAALPHASSSILHTAAQPKRIF